MSVEFVEDLPPAGPGGRPRNAEYDAILHALTERPGVWAVVAEGLDDRSARRLQTGLRLRRVHLRQRKADDGLIVVYGMVEAS